MRIIRRVLAVALILLAGTLCLPAQEADLLPRIRAKMAKILQRQPDYTCTETVERTRQVVGSRARIEDTLRLEVALVNGKEMFAWPGSKQFEDRDLSELVSTGMFGNGNFAIYARIVFLADVAVFEDRGEAQLDGRPARHYDFRVSRSTSGFRLRVDDREAVVGFHGSFYADPVTLDLRRMEVEAEDIPAELNVLDAETVVDFGRLLIGDEEFLLPVESQLMMAMPDMVNRNSIQFSSCRKFAGESILSFNDPVLTETAAPAPPNEVEIPPALTLQLDMSELDLMQAAVGDTVRAILRADLKNRRELLAPKGSVASGRIVLLERYPNYFALHIQFHDLDWPGGHARLKLSFDRTGFATRLIGRQADGAILISRQAGTRLSGILMFWRSE
jgi:hypothetical protein